MSIIAYLFRLQVLYFTHHRLRPFKTSKTTFFVKYVQKSYGNPIRADHPPPPNSPYNSSHCPASPGAAIPSARAASPIGSIPPPCDTCITHVRRVARQYT